MGEYRGDVEVPDDGEALGSVVVDTDSIKPTSAEIMRAAPEAVAGLGTIAVSEEGAPINSSFAV